MFANLPETEREAFKGLLDEYFASRSHLLASASTSAATSSTQSPVQTYNQISSLANRASQLGVGQNAGSSGPPPPPASRKPGSAPLAGLSTGKAIGGLNTTSKAAAFGSMFGASKKGEAASQDASPPPPTRSAAPLPPTRRGLGRAVALYDYDGTEAEDLRVGEGEEVELIEKVSEDWWRAKSSEGRQGIVPSTYLRLL
ncbi:protein that induces appearance of [Ceraceosorus bombacis]|uniref:Protein that induces appearance of n=1 Tax=Ceraceosorus bombacis TaxID=401625 RepID=A0A0P1BLJ0_9BASI|nr:protein that induces appearance of [Ceraceosorus bombacis]